MGVEHILLFLLYLVLILNIGLVHHSDLILLVLLEEFLVAV
jgi:hypothetical protein